MLAHCSPLDTTATSALTVAARQPAMHLVQRRGGNQYATCSALGAVSPRM
jgi:hypothetical protein